MKMGLRLSVAGAGVVFALAGAACGQEPKHEPALPPAKTGAAVGTAEELLSSLEKADAGIKSIQADLRLTVVKNILEGGEKQIRTGKLYFKSEEVKKEEGKPAATNRSFEVAFTKLEVDNVRHDDDQAFAFDGHWLAEKYPDRKFVHKREVVAPGETIDPLAIGQGPFPVPIGQKKDKILERFTAELLPAGDGFPEGKAPESMQETYQIKLVPKKGTLESRDYKEVRIWYLKKDLLPRMAKMAGTQDDTTEVWLTNVEVNKPLPGGVCDTAVPPGWDAQIDDFRRTRSDE